MASQPSATSQSSFSQYSLFPITRPNLYKFYELQRDNFWVPKEIDLSNDIVEWRTILTPNDKHFLLHVLAFFAQADGLVLQNIDCNFSLDIDIPEAKIFYGIQAGIEAIHWETYALLIETLVDDEQAKARAFQATQHYPCIKRKAEWISKWMNREAPFLDRVIAFTCIEGIFFSSSFASIYYYKKRGLMPGLVHSNKFIARDEGLHRDFGCELYRTLSPTPNIAQITKIVREAVEIESEFVRDSLRVDLIGINAESMIQYVQFVADHLLTTLGLPKQYNVTNPFDWMEMISLIGKQNFFEGRVSDYSKVTGDTGFAMGEDF